MGCGGAGETKDENIEVKFSFIRCLHIKMHRLIVQIIRCTRPEMMKLRCARPHLRDLGSHSTLSGRAWRRSIFSVRGAWLSHQLLHWRWWKGQGSHSYGSDGQSQFRTGLVRGLGEIARILSIVLPALILDYPGNGNQGGCYVIQVGISRSLGVLWWR